MTFANINKSNKFYEFKINRLTDRDARTDMISAQILPRIIALGSRCSTPSVIKGRSSGFATGRSTVDHILALSILAQTRRQFHQPLLNMFIAAIAYVDLKVAFDTVNRKCGSASQRNQSFEENTVHSRRMASLSPSMACGPGAYLTWTEGATFPSRNYQQIKFCIDMQ